MDIQSDNEKLVFKMTGKTFKDVECMMQRMNQRSEKIKEHQRMIRDVFDVRWPAALEAKNKEQWDSVCEGIDGVMMYLENNSRYFPNYDKHMEQWNTLKVVAKCVCCGYAKPCDNACIEKT